MTTPPPYKIISSRTTLVVLFSNLCGALVIFLFFSVIDPLPKGQMALSQVNSYQIILFSTLTAFLLALGLFFTNRTDALIQTWYNNIQAGLPASEVPRRVKRIILEAPLRDTLASLGMWVLAGLFFGFNEATFSWRQFLSIVGVSGVLTTAISFTLYELAWRPILPVFFPDGKLSAAQAFRLPVLTRLLIAFLLTSLYPTLILAILAYQRAEMLLSAPNPQIVLNNLWILIVFVVSVSIVTSVGMAWTVTHTIVVPIQQLQAQMERVEQNDLNAQAAVSSNDEVGMLSEGFNDMVAGLRRGELLRNLLNVYVSPEIARAALEAGTRLEGEVVECSVVFSDIREFTSLSEHLPPQELLALLNHYMRHMVAVIVQQGGIVNKFGGDSILAIFGTPLNPAQDHAARAVSAAEGMLAALEKFNQEQVAQNAQILRIGIGIATGPVVAGNVGGEQRLEYTVIGDAVNLAARLQTMTKELGHPVLMDAQTYHAARLYRALEGQPLPPVTVRGKSQTVDVFTLAKSAAPQRPFPGEGV